MRHERIVRELDRLVHKASSDQTLAVSWTGFARVIESLATLAKASDDPLVRQTYQPLVDVLKGIESAGSFQAIDFTDTRTDEEINLAIFGHTFEPIKRGE